MSFVIRTYTGEVAWQKADPQHFGMNIVICNSYVLMQKVRVRNDAEQLITYEWEPVQIKDKEPES